MEKSETDALWNLVLVAEPSLGLSELETVVWR